MASVNEFVTKRAQASFGADRCGRTVWLWRIHQNLWGRNMKAFWIAVAISFTGATGALADQNWGGQSQCALSQGVINSVQSQLATVITSGNGGLFKPNRMWSAIVDRQGVLCSVVRSDPDAWPGSRSIAIAKAATANNFSNSQLALSTAMLYSFTQ